MCYFKNILINLFTYILIIYSIDLFDNLVCIRHELIQLQDKCDWSSDQRKKIIST